ncbi:uncharacterized protein DUF5017 [Hypnocyclicus thermotrophus]|uniref:Uncharacterized protein DUF5017 n=1 Tax=Hypnocyclicus thermotrophus TaxID=1627895 RepID=A0AA46I5Q9_9FUSO|nr:DUF5017 domain-containing protein [Hypnocyclicus thermotrophus]TDT71369.1 uncharacterized protein DUF5017 [Hypnocyclicus thermotrophus]
MKRSLNIIFIISILLLIISCNKDLTVTPIDKNVDSIELNLIDNAYNENESLISDIENGNLASNLNETDKREVLTYLKDISKYYRQIIINKKVEVDLLNEIANKQTLAQSKFNSSSTEYTKLNTIITYTSNAKKEIEPPIITLTEVNTGFSDTLGSDDFTQTGWLTEITKGNINWSYNSKYTAPSISAYKSSDAENETYLISPVLNVTAKSYVTLNIQADYYKHSGLSVLISEDFNGYVSKANWTDITNSIQLPSTRETVDTTIDLDNYLGKKIVIAFKYNGNANNSETTTYAIKNFKFIKKPITITLNSNYTESLGDDNFTCRGWYSIITKGTRAWEGNAKYKNTSISAYNSSDAENESYLISPIFDVTVKSYVTLKIQAAYYKHSGLSVLISEDFNGDISKANWTDITSSIQLPTNSETVDTTIDLDNYLGKKIVIAFKYNGNATNNETTTYRLSDFNINLK